jgi:hypothetical protein
MTSGGTEAYTVASREDAIDFMADYAEYGEQRWYTDALSAEQVSFSWRRIEAGPQTAVRVPGDAFRSVHNDTDDEAEVLIFSPRLEAPPTETQEGFWPSA